jgi:uncharacterized lipoprotein
MPRTLATFVAAVIAVALLAACGSSDDATTSAPGPSTTTGSAGEPALEGDDVTIEVVS